MRDAVWKKIIFTSILNEKMIRVEENGSFLGRSLWLVSPGNLRSGQPLKYNLRQESRNVGIVFKLVFSHLVKVLLDLLAETMVQIEHAYALHEDMLPVSLKGYVRGEIFF